MKTGKEHRFEDNPMEKLFVDEFIEDYSKSNQIDMIVYGTINGTTPKDYLSNREKQIVLATIQWLGSTVGQGFLRNVEDISKRK